MRTIWYFALSCCLLTAAFFAVGFGATSENADAFPGIANTWSSTYSSSTSFTDASCQLCHMNSSGGDGWNAYGWSIRQQINDEGLSVSDAIDAVAAQDADGNGISNLSEITANAQPGWRPGAANSIYFSDGSVQEDQAAPASISLYDAGTATIPGALKYTFMPLMQQ